MNTFLCHYVIRLVRRVSLVSTICLLCYPGNVPAQPTEVEALRGEVEVLKKRVQELQSAKCVKARKSLDNPWHSLQVSMSKAEVKALLGKPGKVHKWKTGEAWYFPDTKCVF